MANNIPSPKAVPSAPDKYTKAAQDFTAPKAEQRVLYVNFRFFKYGTNDKTHAAAIVLSSILLLMIAGLVFFSEPTEMTEKAFGWLGSTFTFVTGIALGGKITGGKKSGEDDF